MKKLLSFVIITLLATTMAVSACCRCPHSNCNSTQTTCPCACVTKPACPYCPYTAKPVSTNLACPKVEPVKAKKSFVRKLKFWNN